MGRHPILARRRLLLTRHHWPAEAGQLTTFPAEVIGESGIAFGAPPVVAHAYYGSMSREQAIR